jgi:hypothetical protein
MPNKVALYCDRPSVTAWGLAKSLGIKHLTNRDPIDHWKRQRKLRGDTWTIINYGTSGPPWWDIGVNYVNPPLCVAHAVSKVSTYAILELAGVPCVKWTDERDTAQHWLDRGYRVLTRKDRLSQGRGTREGVHDLVGGGFYSRVFPKTHEFRVHVGGSNVLDFVEKKAPLAEVRVDRLVRAHSRGWVFAHGSLSVTPEDAGKIGELAIRAVKALRLDFGAVDVLAILDKETPRRVSKAVVCEVNTAPGLSSITTLERYLAYFDSIIGARAPVNKEE